jgi:hypothetical protein
MIYLRKILLSLLIIFVQTISAEDEMAKVTFVKKNTKVTIGTETKIPQMGDDLPLSAKIESNEKGGLEFEYKGTAYKIGQKTTVVISDFIKTGGETSFKPGSKSDVAGVRGLKEKKKGKGKKNTKKKKPASKVEN